MRKQNILITTTDIIQGHEIDEYCGYINATATIGTGFFTEWASSISDLFGTKSYAIDNKITEIKNSVIYELESKAINLKCNAIVGLSVDVDEISSGNNMMFTVTASGTAVKINDLNTKFNIEIPIKEQVIDGDYLCKIIVDGEKCITQLLDLKSGFLNLNKDANTLITEFNNISEEIVKKQLYNQAFSNYIDCFMYALFSTETKVVTQYSYIILNNYDSKVVLSKVMDILVNKFSDYQNLIRLKNSLNFKNFIQYLLEICSFKDIYEYMFKVNNNIIVLIFYPMLCMFRDQYTYGDIEYIDKIIHRLKERYYNEEILDKYVELNERICVCGKLLNVNGVCSCGKSDSITVNTFRQKCKSIDILTSVSEHLKEIYNENNNKRDHILNI